MTTQVRQAIDDYAGHTWSDRAEHDPGMTMLEALAYGVSDLAYRHTLPLKDLLTPQKPRLEPENKQGPKPGIFSTAYGPEQVLTCGPVTEDDYRRALLDLRCKKADAEDTTFCFRNVRLVREKDDTQYRYQYDMAKREYRFSDSSDGEALTLLGGYNLYVELNRNVDRCAAETVLDEFLKSHRNLCEQVRKFEVLKPKRVDVFATIELDDECQDPDGVVARFIELAEALVSPQARRASADSLRETHGMRNEAIYAGPRLENGWITELPPAREAEQPWTLDISALVQQVLKNIDGVKHVLKLSLGKGTVWTQPIEAGYVPQLWGDDLFATLKKDSPVRLLKRGQWIQCKLDKVKEKLRVPHCDPDNPQPLGYGRPRNPRYYSAGQKLPPCYDLKNPDPKPQQRQLHQFLLPFEQMLANGCDALGRLPELLAFERSGAPIVRGGKWPFSDDPVLTRNQGVDVERINLHLDEKSKDENKELDIIGYLLGYFGNARAPKVWWNGPDAEPERFLDVQRGYLAQQPQLAYARASIRLSEVSALQRRIAARLGIGKELFDESSVQLNALPFYVIEHPALLPAEPNLEHVEYQNVETVEKISDGLELTLHEGVTLKRGQLVDLDVDQRAILGVMVHEANGRVIRLRYEDHTRLTDNCDRIIKAGDDGKLMWRSADVWLKGMSHELTYAPDQRGLQSNQRRISTDAYLEALNEDTWIRFSGLTWEEEEGIAPIAKSQGNQRAARTSTKVDEIREPGRCKLLAKIKSTQPLDGTFVAELVDDSNGNGWPENTKQRHYRWIVDEEKNESALQDRFSFTVSVVFDRSRLDDSPTPEDKLVTAEWVKQVVNEEMPCHIRAQIHWIDTPTFKNFGRIYARWQNDDEPLGDMSYHLLSMLALGDKPAPNRGIGTMAIATKAQYREAFKLAQGDAIDGTARITWRKGDAKKTNFTLSIVKKYDLFFVPNLGDTGEEYENTHEFSAS
ncbi:hypothetical protein DIE19_28660 [Burkholderia sp. Bp9126]|nr:hypothetical protein DIE19_28660 [Burkholderia sp. Bp9126]